MEILDSAIEKVLSGLKGGYVDTFYWDCDWPGLPTKMKQPINFEACSSTPFNPVMALVKPPEIETNPYTGEPMHREMHLWT